MSKAVADKAPDGPDGFFVVPVNVTVKAATPEEARQQVMAALDNSMAVQNVVAKKIRPACDSDMDGFDYLFQE